MRRPIIFPILAVLLCLTLSSPASAALSITAAPSPPAGPQVLLASPAPAAPGSYLWTHGTGTPVGVGQTFRLDHRAGLDRITVLVRPLTAEVPGEGVSLQLLTFDGVADVTPAAPVWVGAAPLPRSMEVGEATFLVFDLDDVELEAGTQYGFVLEFIGGGDVDDARADVLHTASDTYPAGRPFLKESGPGGAVYTPRGSDLVFYLEGTTDGPPGGCEVPLEPALTTTELPGFRFWVRFGIPAVSTWWGEAEPLCIPETLCVSGAVPGRTEVLLRIVGPKPNGYLWPTLVKLSTSRIEVWVQQTATGIAQCYVLEGAEPGVDVLEGLFDRTGFLP